MKTRKLLFIILLFSLSFFLISCEGYFDNSSKIYDLEQQLGESKNENEDLQIQIEELEKEIDNLVLKEENLKNHNTDLENSIIEITLEIESLNAQVVVYEEELNSLLNSGENVDSEVVSLLEDKIAELNIKIAQNDLEIEKLRNELSLLEADLQLIHETISSKNLEILDLENIILEFEIENDNLNQKIDSLFDLFNDVSYIAMKANVMVKVDHKNYFGSGVASQGSGVIFHEDENYYYVLTNNHVIYDNPNYQLIEYFIYDYKGNEIGARLHSLDPDYDLGLLYFPKGDEVLNILPLSQDNPSVDTTVISMGQPRGQINTISFGEVINYQKISLNDASKEQSNVTFDVIRHNSPINNGSSGGVLINANFEIVGINYAGTNMDENPSTFSYAIPVTKVREYLSLYEFNMN